MQVLSLSICWKFLWSLSTPCSILKIPFQTSVGLCGNGSALLVRVVFGAALLSCRAPLVCQADTGAASSSLHSPITSSFHVWWSPCSESQSVRRRLTGAVSERRIKVSSFDNLLWILYFPKYVWLRWHRGRQNWHCFFHGVNWTMKTQKKS